MATLQFVSKPVDPAAPMKWSTYRRTKPPGRPYACWHHSIASRVPSKLAVYVGPWTCPPPRWRRMEFVILVSRGAEVRPEFRSALIEGYCVPEISDAAIGDGERETMGDQADGIDSVPVSEWSRLGNVHNETPERTKHRGTQHQRRWRRPS
jgi:hypothetical protein